MDFKGKDKKYIDQWIRMMLLEFNTRKTKQLHV